MTIDTNEIIEARKALYCLYGTVDTSIADDVRQRVEAAIASLAAELTGLRKENDTLRGLLGNSSKDCQYCGLPASEQGKCKSGFPGCSRAGDQQLGEYFATGYALECCEKELAQAKEQLAAREAAIFDLAEVVGFYANPETYFAIGFFPDPPNGKFMNDFYETELGQKPGKRARAILDKHGDVSFDNLREHEAKVLEEAAAELEGEVQDVSKVVEPLIAEYENRAVRRHQSVLRCMAQERRGHET